MAVSSLKNKTKLSTLTSPFDIDLGGMIPLATVAVTSSTATVSFSSIPDYYEHLQVRVLARTGRTGQIGDFFKTTFNSDTGNNYAWHLIVGTGSSVAGAAGSSVAYAEANRFASSDAGSNTFGGMVLDILDYANTNKFKTMRYLGGIDSNGSGEIQFGSGLWQSTSAINSITFTQSGSYNILQNSHFALYGIKRAGA